MLGHSLIGRRILGPLGPDVAYSTIATENGGNVDRINDGIVGRLMFVALRHPLATIAGLLSGTDRIKDSHRSLLGLVMRPLYHGMRR